MDEPCHHRRGEARVSYRCAAQTAARLLARSTLVKDQLLALARQHLPRADPLVLSTVLECFRSGRDLEVGEALVQVLRQSPAALGTLGEERLKTLLAAYPEGVQQMAGPLFQQLREAEKARLEKLRRFEPLLTAGGDAQRVLAELMLRLHEIAFGAATGSTAAVEASYVPLFSHLALVLAAGIFLPGPLVAWFQTVARLLG